MSASAPLWTLVGVALGSKCLNGDCYPGNEFCGEPFENAPAYHLMDQHGCGENDPNGPVFDPVHGVFHHFYQIHLAATPGKGPNYGHFVSKDFVHWAALPVAVWNGLDSSVWPPTVTPYDNEAIYTGSALVVDGAGPGGQPGVVNIYPGLCNKDDWPGCDTGTLIAQAVPADYANDELLTNWTKPSYNPTIENTQRDPSGPWKMESGEWRMRTYDSMVYGAASDADILAGRWYTIGKNPTFRTCECPSLYPLPASSPGLEAQRLYAEHRAAGTLPTSVHKTSCEGDWWQMGTYTGAAPKVLGSFGATPGWEDVFEQLKVDQGAFYASKDNVYPSLKGDDRRINWGWAQVGPASTQTLPREITFNAAARRLQQYPIEELQQLRGSPIYDDKNVTVDAKGVRMGASKGVARQSEVVVEFLLPAVPATMSVMVGNASGARVTRLMTKTDMPGADYNITHYPVDTDAKVCQAACDADDKCVAWTYVVRGDPAGSGDCCLKAGDLPCPKAQSTCTSGAKVAQELPGCGGSGGVLCTIDFSPNTNASASFYEVPVACSPGGRDTLRLVPAEKALEVRLYSDWTMAETFFQGGRVAMVSSTTFDENADITIKSSSATTASATAYPMQGIWVSSDEVRKTARIYP